MPTFDVIAYERSMSLLEKYFAETLTDSDRLELSDLTLKYPEVGDLHEIMYENAPEAYKRKSAAEIARGIIRIRKSIRQQRRNNFRKYLGELFVRQSVRSFWCKFSALFVKQRLKAILDPPYQKKSRRTAV